jgi:hypothetical protein
MNKKAVITIVLFFTSLAMYATGQDGDIIYIDGKQWGLLGKPIWADHVLAQDLKAALPKERSYTSANWDGYMAYWSIQNDTLCLDSIQYMRVTADKKTQWECIPAETLQRVFKNYYNGKKIVAGWVNRDIRVAQGKMLYYEHMGYERNYEEEQIVSIDHGKVIVFSFFK